MPSFSATRAACSGAAPPKAISVRGRRSFPLSMACTRAAFAMFSSTISLMPSAACSVTRFSAAPIRSAAAPVAHRSRLRAGAVRTDDDAPERVDARDRAAAGADLDHFDHRDAQRQPAALEKAVDPRHLEGARGLRLRLVDEADLRGRPAHVEG